MIGEVSVGIGVSVVPGMGREGVGEPGARSLDLLVREEALADDEADLADGSEVVIGQPGHDRPGSRAPDDTTRTVPQARMAR